MWAQRPLEALNLVMHIGKEAAHLRDQHLHSCTVTQLQTLMLYSRNFGWGTKTAKCN